MKIGFVFGKEKIIFVAFGEKRMKNKKPFNQKEKKILKNIILTKKMLADIIILKKNKDMILPVCINFLKKIKFQQRHKIEYLAGVIYLSCRKLKISLSLEEMATALGIEKKEIGKAFKKIRKQLKMHTCKTATVFGASCITLPKYDGFLIRNFNILNVSDNTKKYGIKIYNYIIKEMYECGNPLSVMAGIISLSTLINNEKKTLKVVADIFKITEGAIREAKKKIIKKVPFVKLDYDKCLLKINKATSLSKERSR